MNFITWTIVYLGKFGIEDSGCPMKIPAYKNHPGGETNLEVARQSARADLLFLSYHIGHDLDGIIHTKCKALGVIP